MVESEKDKKGENKDEIKNPFDTSVVRTYYNGHTSNNNIYLMLIDTEREKEIELGRSYPYKKLKEGECLVHKSLIRKNQKIFNISLSMDNFITNTLLYYYNDIKKEPDPNLENFKDIKSLPISFTCENFDDKLWKRSR